VCGERYSAVIRWVIPLSDVKLSETVVSCVPALVSDCGGDRTPRQSKFSPETIAVAMAASIIAGVL